MKACFLTEPSLCMHGFGSFKSGILVDIGANSTTIVPVYESMILRKAIQVLDVGGEHITDFMEVLLDSLHLRQQSECLTDNGGEFGGLADYSSAISRRRKQIARECKEKSAFVSQHFPKDVQKYGVSLTQEGVKVMIKEKESGIYRPSPCAPSSLAHDHLSDVAEITQVVELESHTRSIGVAQDDNAHRVSLSTERFHCCEILFDPEIMKSYVHSPNAVSAAASGDDFGVKSSHFPSAKDNATGAGKGLVESILDCVADIDDDSKFQPMFSTGDVTT